VLQPLKKNQTRRVNTHNKSNASITKNRPNFIPFLKVSEAQRGPKYLYRIKALKHLKTLSHTSALLAPVLASAPSQGLPGRPQSSKSEVSPSAPATVAALSSSTTSPPLEHPIHSGSGGRYSWQPPRIID
jgi:hypothetical protein